ncbi:uncharacterized protein JN550_012722 [Neoarthrinium moseri]|uniref:uncharacterized protein n=1 Tax=Neoarthrinium moseri TaxID=1658444 RepID=UPI001FDC2A9C|nr:uncharacterized protein JN550_012722 [Neoarthrinium moseri]KAI1858357.1 hypothetical protein JN550_012722 [Neoarthrinium moseri]
MGFLDVLTDGGLAVLNSWLETRSYIIAAPANTGAVTLLEYDLPSALGAAVQSSCLRPLPQPHTKPNLLLVSFHDENNCYAPTQADVATFKALKSSPDAAKYPHAARWYKHIATFEDEFATLSGDASKPYTAYGPDKAEATLNPAKAPAKDEDEDDAEGLFDSDSEEEDAEAVKAREERLKAYRDKKAAKPKPVAKSIVTMDVKPWDDETDMVALEAAVRGIEKEGLVWGGSKLVAVGFGIKKLQINLVVEDEKVSTDELQEQIQDFEDYVQSTDIVAMQKL